MKYIFFFLSILGILQVHAQVTCTTTDPILINDVNSGNTSVNYTLKLDGISGYSLSNQLLGSNSSPDALEWKTLAPGTSGSDFNIAFSAGAIIFNLPDAGSSTRGVVNTSGSGQTFAGPKTFTSDLSISGSTTNLFLTDGVDQTTPSLAFTSNPGSGFSYTNSTKTLFLSLNGVYGYQWLSGEFDMKNCANFIAGAGKLDINITHDADSESPKQDGGVSVSTYSGTETKTCTFGGRTANGTESEPASTVLDQAMVEFVGKGYVLCPFEDPEDCDDYGFEHTNRGVFGVYASETHSLSSQGAYCAIQTTRIGTTSDHFSFLVDAAGNGGLTYNKIIPIAYPDLWSDGTDPEDDYDSRFFTVESETNTADVGLFLQNNNALKGLNIWLDNDQDISYIDNIRNSNGAAIKFRLKTAGSSVTAMTINAHGSNIGGGTPASGETFSVGSNRDLIVNSSGKLSKYQNTTISDGELLIGKTTGSTFEKTTLTSGTGISVSNGSGAITINASSNYTSTAFKTIANTTTETTLLASGTGSLTINANTLTVGKTYIIKAYGYVSTDASAPNWTVKAKLGSTEIASTTGAAPASLSNRRVEITVIFTCYTIGTSGTIAAQGSFGYNSNATNGFTREMVNTSTITLNTETNQTIDLTFTWSAADTDNTITITNATIEAVK